MSQRRKMSERLKISARAAGIKGDFTTCNSRYSWPTIAKHLGISTELISEALGHRSFKMTQIQLKDLDNEVLNKVTLMVTFYTKKTLANALYRSQGNSLTFS